LFRSFDFIYLASSKYFGRFPWHEPYIYVFGTEAGVENLQEFAASTNGDRWLLGKDNVSGADFVIHRANLPSGGHETRTSVRAFLAQGPANPEREALLSVLREARSPEETSKLDDEKTPSLKLAEEYLGLGGTRRAKVDDNIVSTRKWEDEPAEAKAFWEEKIEPLNDKQHQEVEIHLPSISDD
jgi:hypothetical protein